jgi:hypothetical protein
MVKHVCRVLCVSTAAWFCVDVAQASAGLRSSMVVTAGSFPSLLGSTPVQAGPLPLLAELEERNQQLEAEALQAQQSWDELSECVVQLTMANSGMLQCGWKCFSATCSTLA